MRAFGHLQKTPAWAKADFIGPTQPVWQREKFPTLDVSMRGEGPYWVAARYSVHKPYCWTPAKPFWFGGKQFVWGYPCIAYATANFGWVIQKGPHGFVIGRE